MGVFENGDAKGDVLFLLFKQFGCVGGYLSQSEGPESVMEA